VARPTLSPSAWAVPVSVALHGVVLGAALLALRPAGGAASPPGPTRLGVVASETRWNPAQDVDPAEARDAPAPLEPDPVPFEELPDVTLDPEPPAPEAESVLAAEAPTAPASHWGLTGRRLGPPASVPAAPAPAVPASAPRPLRILVQPDPTYPAGVTWRGELRLALLLRVDTDGAVGEVVVERGSGLPALDAHVRAFLAQHWRFAPLDAPRWVRQGFRIPPPT
jgi:outer membrane biosynthesis protein TonB